MSVPKSRRKESRFEAQHHFIQLRDEVTKLVLYDFGFSTQKYDKQIEKFREWHKNDTNIDAQVALMVHRSESFDKWFIDEV